MTRSQLNARRSAAARKARRNQARKRPPLVVREVPPVTLDDVRREYERAAEEFGLEWRPAQEQKP